MSSTAHRAAASTLLRSSLTSGNRWGRVLGVFPSVVYVEMGGDLIAVEASDALRLPCSIVLPVPTAARPFAALQPGDPVATNGAQLTVGALTVDVVRWWRPRRPRTIDAYDVARLSVVAAALPPLTSPVAERLADLVRALQPEEDPSGESPTDEEPSGEDLRPQTVALLGLGDGLTPQGDDVLVGVLVALRSRPATRSCAHRLGAAVAAAAPTRTTLVSAALLRHANEGHAIPRLVDVLDALGGQGTDGELAAAVVRLRAVGHSSGTGLAHGVLAAGRMHAATQVRSHVA